MADALEIKEDAKTNEHSTSIRHWCILNYQAVVAEFLASSFLTLFGCMSCIPIAGLDVQPPLKPSLGFGLTVLFTIQIFGHISGAHFNPAVTLAAVVYGITSPILGLCYALAQFAGAVAGYGILITISQIDFTDNGICVTVPQEGLTTIQALGIETLLTAALIFICCAIWDPRNQANLDSAPIKFGLAVTGICVVGGPLTGAGINPARSLAPAVWTGLWEQHWVYWAGPFIGAASAVIIYKYLLLVPAKLKSTEELPLA